MIQIEITKDIISRAKESCTHGALRGSVTKGERNLIGYIGEELFQLALPMAIRSNNFNFDFILHGSSVDVKASQIPEVPKPFYTNNIYAFNTEQKCDFYCFVQINRALKSGWLIGWIDKREFFEKATFYQEGDFAPNSKKIKYRADSYVCRNNQLREFK